MNSSPDRHFWDFPLFPDQGSNWAKPVDHLMVYALGISLFFAFIVFTMVIVFAVRYHHRTHVDRSNPPLVNLPLELAWSAIPFILLMTLFLWGSRLYVSFLSPPSDAIPMYVVGRQWMWKIQHPEGPREINAIHIPVGKPVKLVMTSQDVIHDFFIPGFRIKRDVLPGRYTEEWFTAVKPGRYAFFCSQYCGTSHSSMIGQIIAMDPGDFSHWLEGRTDGTMAQEGERLFRQYGCAACHRDDALRRAPVLDGLYGKTIRLRGGRLQVADEEYIRESILNPNAKVVDGFDNIMPVYSGQVTEDEVLQLIAYVKSLRGPA